MVYGTIHIQSRFQKNHIRIDQPFLEFHSFSLKYLTCHAQVKDAGFLEKQHSLKRGFSFKHALFLETGIFLK